MNCGFHIPDWCKKFEDLLETAYDNFWRPPNPDKFGNDKADWNTMDPGVKRRLKGVLRCFTNMEIEIVDDVDYLKDLLHKHLPDDVNKELQIFYTLVNWQEAIEGIHLQTYARIDQILPFDIDSEVSDYVNKKVELISSMRSKPTNTPKDISKAIISMICNEGLIFQSLFSVFFVARARGKLIETYTQNSYVLRDELFHLVTFAVLYDLLTKRGIIPRLEPNEVYDIINLYVDTDIYCAEKLLHNLSDKEKEFFLQFNVDNCKLYTKYIADTVLQALNYEPYYRVKSHNYDFMNSAQLNTLGSFFDVEITDYSLSADFNYQSESDISDDE